MAKNEPLHSAVAYQALGWSIIPIRSRDKKAAVKWKPYQEQRADDTALRRWFGNGSAYGMAVVLGEVSGGLVCRDFDDMAAYDAWAATYSELAKTLPTVETGRPGRHVYALASPDQIQELTGGGTVTFADGELRAGGGYCVLPPSIHPSGRSYRWLIEPDDAVLEIDLLNSGFLPCNREDRENVEDTGGQKTLSVSVSTVPSLPSAPSLLHEDSTNQQDGTLDEQIQNAIASAMLTGSGQRHRMVFELARAIKTIPALADAAFDELKPIVQRWHTLAKSRMRTKAFEESWFDFCEAWPKVKFPKGKEPIVMMFSQAIENELPEVAKQYEQQELRQLVALCRELQRADGTAPFFLAARTAGGLLDVTHTTAWRWLRGLQHDGILKEVEKGNQATRKASRYRYLAPLRESIKKSS